jgi:hypothetical protein
VKVKAAVVVWEKPLPGRSQQKVATLKTGLAA